MKALERNKKNKEKVKKILFCMNPKNLQKDTETETKKKVKKILFYMNPKKLQNSSSY